MHVPTAAEERALVRVPTLLLFPVIYPLTKNRELRRAPPAAEET